MSSRAEDRHNRLSELFRKAELDIQSQVSIETRIETLRQLAAKDERLREAAERRIALIRRHYTLMSQIEQTLATLRAGLLSAKHRREPFSFGADDVREEARLCREEAAAMHDMDMRASLERGARELVTRLETMDPTELSPVGGSAIK